MIAQTMIRHGLHPIVVSALQAHFAQELDLGVAFNWTAINETVDALFAAHGEVRPSAPALPEPTPAGNQDGGAGTPSPRWTATSPQRCGRSASSRPTTTA
ncbi:MAG: hypothetical protein ABWY29_05840 [Blastococcus sp.]